MGRESEQVETRRQFSPQEQKELVDLAMAAAHVASTGPHEIQRVLDATQFANKDVEAATKALVAPFTKTGLGGSEKNFDEFSETLKGLAGNPEKSQAIVAGFNSVMSQYGVSLEKQGDNWNLKSTSQSSDHQVVFDPSGAPIYAESRDKNEKFGDLVMCDSSKDKRFGLLEFGSVAWQALYDATVTADKSGNAKGH